MELLTENFDGRNTDTGNFFYIYFHVNGRSIDLAEFGVRKHGNIRISVDADFQVHHSDIPTRNTHALKHAANEKIKPGR